MRAARLCGLLAALQAHSCAGLRTSHEPAASKAAAKVAMNGQLLQQAVGATKRIVTETEAQLASDQRDVRETILYVDKIKESFGKQDSLWNGKMDQGDQKMAKKLLGLMADKNFLQALDQAFKDLQQAVKHIPALSEKRVREAVKRPHDTPDERFLIASAFFKQETSLLGTQLAKVSGFLRTLMEAMPQEYSAYKRLGYVLLQDLAEVATNITGHFTGSEEIFCEHVRTEIKERALPMIEYTKSLLPRVETYANATMPEVLPAVTKAMTKLKALHEALAKLFGTDVTSVVERVCASISNPDRPPAVLDDAPAATESALAQEAAAPASLPAPAAPPAAAAPAQEAPAAPAAPAQAAAPAAATAAPAAQQ